MSAHRDELLLQHLPDPERFTDGEAALLPRLMQWLVATGRVGPLTRVAHEVPWLGRRVDLALLTGRGFATAFELKIGRLERALEQAAYNGASFHRSWVVTGNRPRTEGRAWAVKLGVGVLVVQKDRVAPVIPPAVQAPHPAVVKRLQTTIQGRAGVPAR